MGTNDRLAYGNAGCSSFTCLVTVNGSGRDYMLVTQSAAQQNGQVEVTVRLRAE